MKAFSFARNAPLALACVLLFSVAAARAADQIGPWPEQCDPKDVGRRLVQNLLARPSADPAKAPPATQPTTRPARMKRMPYPEICTSYGSLRFAGAIADQDLLKQLEARYAYIGAAATRYRSASAGGVDASVFGILPMEIYRQAGDTKYLEIGQHYADNQWVDPRDDGLSKQTRFWIDDMFMITALQTQAYRVTHDKTYLERAANELVAYLDKLQQPNGLFYHRDDAPIYWGRGNGWVAVGMAELLSVMPADHPKRQRILDSYHKQLAALLKTQDTDCMWHQILDDPKSWPETSCTGMFICSMAMGVHNGRLDADAYKQAARKGWIAQCSYLDQDANVREVCIGTNPSPKASAYLDRQRKTGDMHGQAATLWAAWALLPQAAQTSQR